MNIRKIFNIVCCILIFMSTTQLSTAQNTDVSIILQMFRDNPGMMEQEEILMMELQETSAVCVKNRNHRMGLYTYLNYTPEMVDTMKAVMNYLIRSVADADKTDTLEREHIPFVEEIVMLEYPEIVPETYSITSRVLDTRLTLPTGNVLTVDAKLQAENHNLDIIAHWIARLGDVAGISVVQCDENYEIRTFSIGVETTASKNSDGTTNYSPTMEEAIVDVYKLAHELGHTFGLTHPVGDTNCGFPNAGYGDLEMTSMLANATQVKRIDAYFLATGSFFEIVNALTWLESEIGREFLKSCTVSTNDLVLLEKFKIYPNPSSEQLSIQIPDEVRQVNIFDNFGRKVYSYETDGSVTQKTLQVDISDWNGGMYRTQILSSTRNAQATLSLVVSR